MHYRISFICVVITVTASARAQVPIDRIGSRLGDRKAGSFDEVSGPHDSGGPAKPVHVSDASAARRAALLNGNLGLGFGMTYQYDGRKGTDLGVATWSLRDNNHEIAAFRFLTTQTRRGISLAEPN